MDSTPGRPRRSNRSARWLAWAAPIVFAMIYLGISVLAADVLGISTLVALRNNPQTHGQTAYALLGPFWRLNAPDCACGV